VQHGSQNIEIGLHFLGCEDVVYLVLQAVGDILGGLEVRRLSGDVLNDTAHFGISSGQGEAEIAITSCNLLRVSQEQERKTRGDSLNYISNEIKLLPWI
jgi:hypothetical protein